MASSFEKSVKGGTKIKLAAPKSKYVEHILVATHAGEAGVAEIFRTMTTRLRDSTWTIVFKALIIVHLMIREGEPNVTLKYLADSPSKLAISSFSDAQDQGRNIRHYCSYLSSRAKAYRDTKLDWVREGQGRLKRQSVDRGLLRETEAVQGQIAELLRCDLLNEPDNEITLTAFRLLTMDLLVLFSVMNEGTIGVLEHYFEMSRVDAERALVIYKTFSKQTDQVVSYLSTARQYQGATRLEIPKLKHAPTSLTASLEEYLTDPDFEINRRQYLAQQESKRSGKSKSTAAHETSNASKKLATNQTSSSSQVFLDSRPTNPASSIPQARGPAPDLIDFFESIEQNQQPMFAQAQQQTQDFQPMPQLQFSQASFQDSFGQSQSQVNGFSTGGNPFAQMMQQPEAQQTVTGNGLSSVFDQQQQAQNQQLFSQNPIHLQSVPQDQTAFFAQQQSPFAPAPAQQLYGGGQIQQPFSTGQQLQAAATGQLQSTNPFRQSMMPPVSVSNMPPMGSPKSTNPFARNTAIQSSNQAQDTMFASPPLPSMAPSNDLFFMPAMPPPQQSPHNPPAAQPLQPTRTGPNPFARTVASAPNQRPATSHLMLNPTGSTNPFRQSMFANQQSWQASQGTMGGLEQLPTVPVFPRPGQQPQQPPQQFL